VTRDHHHTARIACFSVLLLAIVTLAGCSSLPFGQDERQTADAIAQRAGMHADFETAGEFVLLSYRRGLRTSSTTVHVYIEGDGRGWRAGRAPRNPTPTSPMGLRLAAQDPAAAVLWIGRPCMYLPKPAADRCALKWWTSHRYAAAVVDAINTVITRVVGTRNVMLIGHSGGGALAALVASRRDDVTALLTVSSPLDLRYWTEQGNMTPLYGSLSPLDVAHLLAALPQRHLVGSEDRVVPAEVVRRFMRALPSPARAQLQVKTGFTHQCCWERDWPQLLNP